MSAMFPPLSLPSLRRRGPEVLLRQFELQECAIDAVEGIFDTDEIEFAQSLPVHALDDLDLFVEVCYFVEGEFVVGDGLSAETEGGFVDVKYVVLLLVFVEDAIRGSGRTLQLDHECLGVALEFADARVGDGVILADELDGAAREKEGEEGEGGFHSDILTLQFTESKYLRCHV